MRLDAIAIGLLSACAGLGWFAVDLLRTPVSIGEIEQHSPWAPDLPSPPGEFAPRLPGGADPQLLSRLVFSPTRRPPEPRPPEPVASSLPSIQTAFDNAPAIDKPPPEGVTLQGVLIGGRLRQALIVSPDHLEGIWLKPGAEIGGWTLGRIEADRATLKSGKSQIEMTLYVDNSGERVGLVRNKR
jgi:hypothetical protein